MTHNYDAIDTRKKLCASEVARFDWPVSAREHPPKIWFGPDLGRDTKNADFHKIFITTLSGVEILNDITLFFTI